MPFRHSYLSRLFSLVRSSPDNRGSHVYIYHFYFTESNRSSKTAPVNRNVSSTTDDDEGISDPDELDDIQKASESVYRLLAEEDWNTLEPHGHQFRDMIHSCKFNGKDCRWVDTRCGTQTISPFSCVPYPLEILTEMSGGVFLLMKISPFPKYMALFLKYAFFLDFGRN